MADISVYEAVCRQRNELWSKVSYTKLCVDRELNCGQTLVT